MKFDTPYVAAAERNARPILGVIEHELSNVEHVLEIGTGTAQQAVVFSAAMPWLSWQTSDVAANQSAISKRVEGDDSGRLLPPLTLDMLEAEAGESRYDAVYSSNTAHIMCEKAVARMFSYVAAVLRPAGKFVLYGPFRLNGEFTTDSNAAFDRSLREQNAAMGLRDLEALDEIGKRSRLVRSRLYAMPSNNLLAVWHKAVLRT